MVSFDLFCSMATLVSRTIDPSAAFREDAGGDMYDLCCDASSGTWFKVSTDKHGSQFAFG